jgi:electron transport complex protein RnfD
MTDPWDLLSSIAGHMAVGPSPLLVLLCGAYLAARRFMDWRIPVAVLGSAAFTASLLFALDPVRYPNPGFMLFSGGLVLGAVFMASDMATSPVTPRGMWIYGGLIGLLTVVIRYYSGLPEGVMYAILLGNAATPLIERVTQPTPFGKGVLRGARRGASYPLHPDYIPREGAIGSGKAQVPWWKKLLGGGEK